MSNRNGEDSKVVMLPTLEDILQKKRAAAQVARAEQAEQQSEPQQAQSAQEAAEREQAKRLREQVLEEARVQANKEANAILEAARKEREAVLRAAQEEGLASGRAEVFAQAADALALLDDGYRTAVKNLEQTAEQMFEQLQPYMLNTALHIAQKIMHIEFDRNDEAYRALVQHILQNVMNQKNIVLHVSDWEYQRFFGDGAGRLAAELENRKIIVEKDPALDKSECRLASEYGDISVGIEIQLKRLGHALGANW